MTTTLASASPVKTDKRFCAPGEKKSWQVTDQWELHHEIRRRIFLGQKNVVIAQELGCTPQTVSNVRNSDIVRQQLAEMNKAADDNVVNIHKEIAAKTPEALKVLEELMQHSENDAIRAKCAIDILDRGGYAAPKQVQLKGAVVHLNGDDINDIKQRARNASIASGIVIDCQEKLVNE